MTQTTRSSTSESTESGTALGLSHILTSLLPATVHTDGGPERYMINAVFTRRPSGGEILALNGPEARAWLDRAGYPQVTTRVSDRRLEIANTSLEELQAGLGSVLGRLLAEISASDAARLETLARNLDGAEQYEAKRWEEVRARAGAIQFAESAESAARPTATPLGLTHIVAGLLPATLATDSGPGSYAVAAEFTRPPTRTELAMISGAAARDRLDAAGYAATKLAVRDRLFEIRDTSLDELESGLARVVGMVLAEITEAASAADALMVAEAEKLAAAERERERYVAQAVAAVRFDAVIGQTADGPTEVDAWEDEGGGFDGRR
ncbi:hypothetical protein [Gryllotalpicola protaetiae]|nr:hypothetical protein [Gryllotalpicola protaetiae]